MKNEDYSDTFILTAKCPCDFKSSFLSAPKGLDILVKSHSFLFSQLKED